MAGESDHTWRRKISDKVTEGDGNGVDPLVRLLLKVERGRQKKNFRYVTFV